MDLLKDPQTATFIIGGVVSFVVWLLRLEGKVKYQEREIDVLEKQVANLEVKHTNLDVKIVSELSEVKQALARIEGRLERKD